MKRRVLLHWLVGSVIAPRLFGFQNTGGEPIDARVFENERIRARRICKRPGGRVPMHYVSASLIFFKTILLLMVLWGWPSTAQTISFDRVQVASLPSGAPVVGDFNGDGKPDLALVQSNRVLTLLGNGDGTFKNPVGTDTTMVPLAASGGIVADFDGDGRLDLAVSHSKCCFPFIRGDISILLGNGDGTFRQASTIPGASADFVADLNGDGLPDLISGADLLFGPGAVLLSKGNGTFQRRDEPDIFNLWLAVVDIDGDGRADVIYDDLYRGTVWVAFGNGDGSFRAGPTIFQDDQEVGALFSADFDEDGKQDLLSSLQEGGVVFYRGNGDGTFQPGIPVLNSSSITEFNPLKALDVNGDGKLDVIVTLGNPSRLALMIGNGDGTFQSPVEIVNGSGSLFAVADFNNDGRPDLAVWDQGSLYLLLNSTPARLAEPPVISVTGFPTAGFAPGMLVTVRGTFLADSTLAAAQPPLRDHMAGTTVRVNGIAAPLLFVSPSQLNLQIPFDIPSGQGTLQVDRGFGQLFITTLNLVEFAPAIFTTNQTGTGTAVALHADGTLVTNQSPANVGETISIRCTGLGRLSQPVSSGAGAPDPAPSTLATPQVSVGGAPAVVRFSGLVVGYAGVYRVDIVVPAAAPKGTAPLFLSIGGVEANAVSLFIK